jgi:uncharacterized membrane protein required for colicin V production
MALALTVVIALVLVVLGLVGYLRDLRRSLLALLGTLGGAILVNFWGNQWGASLASRLVDADVQRTAFYVNCAVFLWSTLVVGYAGGILLNRARDRSLSQRLTGAVLGLVNGVLIVGFLLRFATSNQPNFAPVIQANPLAKAIHDGLPLLFLAVAGVVTLLVLLRAAFSLFGRGAPPPAQPATPKPAAPQPASSTAEKRIGDPEILKKLTEAGKR